MSYKQWRDIPRPEYSFVSLPSVVCLNEDFKTKERVLPPDETKKEKKRTPEATRSAQGTHGNAEYKIRMKNLEKSRLANVMSGPKSGSQKRRKKSQNVELTDIRQRAANILSAIFVSIFEENHDAETAGDANVGLSDPLKSAAFGVLVEKAMFDAYSVKASTDGIWRYTDKVVCPQTLFNTRIYTI